MHVLGYCARGIVVLIVNFYLYFCNKMSYRIRLLD